jgi:arsenite-transporting ATPase
VPARTILYTGKGGVGKTSVAAATARRCAASGLRTLAISTDPAHSLADSFDKGIGPHPTSAGPNLWGQQISAQAEMERHWSGVQGWLGALLVERGIDRISAEELAVPPGGDELFSLLALRDQHQSGEWDVIVVDCAPTGETLRLLSFPDIARWWLQKVFPFERQILAAARPIARTLLDIPLPTPEVFGDIERLSGNLIAMNDILRDRTACSVRLVMTPDRMVIGEAMKTFTYLNLYGYLTDAIVVNRVFPPDSGEYFERWRALQAEHMERVQSAFSPVPILRAAFLEEEVLGDAMLDRLAGELFGDRVDPSAVLYESVTHEISVSENGALVRIELPLASKESIGLKKVGLELIVTVDGQKRTMILPSALAEFQPTGARFDGGALEVRFDAGAVE